MRGRVLRLILRGRRASEEPFPAYSATSMALDPFPPGPFRSLPRELPDICVAEVVEEDHLVAGDEVVFRVERLRWLDGSVAGGSGVASRLPALAAEDFPPGPSLLPAWYRCGLRFAGLACSLTESFAASFAPSYVLLPASRPHVGRCLPGPLDRIFEPAGVADPDKE